MSLINAFATAIYPVQGRIAPEEISQAAWHKSSFSNLNGNCVEVGRLRSDRVGIRDTKDRGAGPVLVFSGHEWQEFIAGLKGGEFDV